MELLTEESQTAAVAALDKLVANAGYTPEEASLMKASLSETLLSSLATFVKEKEDRCEALVAEVPQLVSKLEEMCAVLQMAHPAPQTANDGDMKLVPRQRELTKALEALNLAHEERKAQRDELEGRMGDMLKEMLADGEAATGALDVPPLPAVDQAEGLSQHVLGQLRASLTAVEAERASRVDTAARLSAEVVQVRAELGEAADEPEASEGPLPRTVVSSSALRGLEAELQGLKEERGKRLKVLSRASEYISDLRKKLKLDASETVDLPPPEKGLTKQVPRGPRARDPQQRARAAR